MTGHCNIRDCKEISYLASAMLLEEVAMAYEMHGKEHYRDQ